MPHLPSSGLLLRAPSRHLARSAAGVLAASLFWLLGLAAGPALAGPQYLQETPEGPLREYFLVVERQVRQLGERPFETLTINGQVPGPVLRFREGERARITVENFLDEPTSFHWHGLLLPNAMDGVAPLTGPYVPAGGSLTYEFPLRQAGTYWYHSHAGLQEQAGLYGAIVVEPREPEAEPPDQDLVLVLSDWIDERPHEVMRTLMRGSDWYSAEKGTLPSILGAWRAEDERPGSWQAYWARERSRLPPMDISDVAYDAFLINGQRRGTQAAGPGQRLRLRLINAGASTYFYVHSSAGPLSVVAADGSALEPIRVKRLLIGIGETYDVELRLPGPGAFELRATAQDGSGHASLFLGSGAEVPAIDPPRPDLYRMEATLLAGILEARRSAGLDDEQALASEPERPLSPYARLRARRPEAPWSAGSTQPPAPEPGSAPAAETGENDANDAPASPDSPPGAAVRELTLRLTGDMRRYVWSLDGRTLAQDSVIPVARGERLRLELVNDTMMHHPMHLHGFFFRLIEGQGQRSPLKHTVDVPPMGKRTIEFDANEDGDWLLHCHLLYHMKAGMTRVVRVGDPPADTPPELPEDMLDPPVFLLDGVISNYMTTGTATLMDARNEFGILWDAGLDETDASGQERPLDGELDLLWSRYLGPNLSPFVGYRFTNEEDADNRWFAGALYRLPYLVTARGLLDSEGDLRLNLSKDFQLAPRWMLFVSGEYDTLREWEFQGQIEYLLSQRFSFLLGFQSRHGAGLGLSLRL
jgi:FtsP/CotA-like multicopper oxidase with cupredoxin domain